jgi:hypothetical protein
MVLSLQAAVTGDQWEAEMDGSCSNDTIWHVGNNSSRDVLKGDGNVSVHRCDKESCT